MCFDEGFDNVEIKLKSAGQLDNIKRIYIGKSIKSINIPNKVFPNVREVKSDNERYVSGTMLVEKRKYYTVSSDRLILLNSFWLREDEVLDLKCIAVIDEDALAGCSAGTVINTEDVKRVNKAAFLRSNIPTRELPEEYNVSMVGTIITDVNTKPGFNTCVIPEDTTLIAVNVFFRSSDVIDVRCKNSVFFRCRPSLWILNSTLIFNAEDDIDEDEFENLKECCVKIGPANKHYVDIDGIIYTSDMKHLVKSNQLDVDLRKIIVPDSVEKICKYAFYQDTSLESVEIPDSVKEIGDYAFIGCRNITSLKLPDSIKKLGYRSLCGMNNLKELEIPGSVDDSNCCCELEGMTTTIKFGEGISEVHLSASCALTSYQSMVRRVELPSTVTKFNNYRREELAHVRVVTLQTENIPQNLLLAMVPEMRYKPKEYSYSSCEALKNEIYCIQTPERTILVPSNISEQSIQEINDTMNRIGAYIPANLFRYCKNTKQKLSVAFLEWQNSHDEITKKYLKRNRKKLVQDLIEEGMDEALARFLKTGIYEKKEIQDVYDIIAEADNMKMSKAYALDIIGSGNKNTFRL
ncbi:leucine-rich repeat domain-containing protein [Blautia massiliensis (ex Durand et al. 2017)]|uniref:leucine-rich repeat domain-containing protein n=1 Tax=Blautia massiliensis (ex Durand et al. 2017) TaxID=1737424 RepID=UPI00189F5891